MGVIFVQVTLEIDDGALCYTRSTYLASRDHTKATFRNGYQHNPRAEALDKTEAVANICMEEFDERHAVSA